MSGQKVISVLKKVYGQVFSSLYFGCWVGQQFIEALLVRVLVEMAVKSRWRLPVAFLRYPGACGIG